MADNIMLSMLFAHTDFSVSKGGVDAPMKAV